MRSAAGGAAVAVKTVAANIGALQEYFKGDETSQVHRLLWDQYQRVHLQVVACGREMRFGSSLEATGLSALLLRATIEDAVAISHSTVTRLSTDSPIDLLQQLDQASEVALAQLQLVIDQMEIETRD